MYCETCVDANTRIICQRDMDLDDFPEHLREKGRERSEFYVVVFLSVQAFIDVATSKVDKYKVSTSCMRIRQHGTA